MQWKKMLIHISGNVNFSLMRTSTLKTFMIIAFVIKNLFSMTVIKWQLYLAHISGQTITELITVCGPVFRVNLFNWNLMLDVTSFRVSCDNVRDFSNFEFQLFSGLIASTHCWRYVLITFTSFKHRIEIIFIFVPILLCLPRAFVACTGKSTETTLWTRLSNLQNVLEIIEKGDGWVGYAHWLIFELASFGSGSAIYQSDNVAQIMLWSDHGSFYTRCVCVCIIFHITCHTRPGKLRHFAACVAASSISTIVPSSGPSQPPPCYTRFSLSFSLRLTLFVLHRSGLKANCTSPRLPLSHTLYLLALSLSISLCPSQQLQHLASHQM